MKFKTKKPPNSFFQFGFRFGIILIVTLIAGFGISSASGSCPSPTFLAATSYPVGTFPRGAAVGDFNGDGKADLITADYYGQSVTPILHL